MLSSNEALKELSPLFIVDTYMLSIITNHFSVVIINNYQELKNKYLAVYFHGLQQTEGVDKGQL